ncbi:MAG: TonB-dependent receptor plug domain-containing protein [Terriglobia bacterium]
MWRRSFSQRTREFPVWAGRCRKLCLLLMIAGLAHKGWAQTNPGIVQGAASQRAVSHHSKDKRRRKRKARQSLTALGLAALGNIKVTTVSKEPEELWRTPDAVYVLTQEDIRRSGATTIPDILRLVPGVEVAQIDSDTWAIGVRGFGGQFSSGLEVLIDGRSVYTPLFGGVYWELQNLPLDEIDRIEVIRGPGGAVWGSNAVDGVINIITKKAKDTHGGLMSVGGGNVDQATTEYRYGAGNGKGFDYRVYGMGFDRGPELHQDHDPFDAWRTGQAGFRADWETGGNDALTLQGDIYDGYDGTRAAIGYYSPPVQVNVDGAAKVAGGNLLGHWRHELSNGSDVQIEAYFDRTSRLQPQYGEIRNTFDIDFHHHLTLPHHQDFNWGLEAQVSPSHFIQTQATVTLVPNPTDELYSGFVQDEIPLVENHLSLTLGSKLLHDNYTGFEVEPSARLMWTPSPHQTFWAGITRAVNTPSDLDEELQITGLYTTNPLPIFIRVIGNAQFFSQQVISYEAGWRSLIEPKLYLDIAAFDNHYDDLSSYETGAPFFETSPPPLRAIVPVLAGNDFKGTTDGFEIGPDWKPTPWWQLKASYSYLHIELRRRAGSPDLDTIMSDEGSSPSDEITVQSLFNLPKKLEFDPTYRYVSALPYLSATESVPAYSTADARFGWRPNSHLEFSITGENLLQPGHVEFISDPGLPVEITRSVYAKTTFRW